MTLIEFSYIVGCKLGIEFGWEMEVIVIDLAVLRLIIHYNVQEGPSE